MKAIILVAAAASAVSVVQFLQPTQIPATAVVISQPTLTQQPTLTVDVAHPTAHIIVEASR